MPRCAHFSSVTGRNASFGAHLDGDAEVVLLEPGPGSDHLDAAVVPVARDVHAALAGDRLGRHLGEGPALTGSTRLESRLEVASGVAHADGEHRGGAGLVGDEVHRLELRVEAAVGEHQALAVEGVGLSGLADLGDLEQAGEVLLGVEGESDERDHPALGVADGRRGVDHRPRGRDAGLLSGVGHFVDLERARDRDLAAENFTDEGCHLGGKSLAEVPILLGRDDAAGLIDDPESGVRGPCDHGAQILADLLQGSGGPQRSDVLAGLVRGGQQLLDEAGRLRLRSPDAQAGLDRIQPALEGGDVGIQDRAELGLQRARE